MLLVLKASSIKCAFFWHCFFKIILFQFKPANRKSALIELTSFQSLFLLNFQVSALNESHHFLVKHSCESACENLDAISARSAVCFFSQYCSLTRSHRGRHCDCAFYIYTLLMCTNTRLSKPSSDIALRHRLPKSIKACAHVHEDVDHA